MLRLICECRYGEKTERLWIVIENDTTTTAQLAAEVRAKCALQIPADAPHVAVFRRARLPDDTRLGLVLKDGDEVYIDYPMPRIVPVQPVFSYHQVQRPGAVVPQPQSQPGIVYQSRPRNFGGCLIAIRVFAIIALVSMVLMFGTAIFRFLGDGLFVFSEVLGYFFYIISLFPLLLLAIMRGGSVSHAQGIFYALWLAVLGVFVVITMVGIIISPLWYLNGFVILSLIAEPVGWIGFTAIVVVQVMVLVVKRKAEEPFALSLPLRRSVILGFCSGVVSSGMVFGTGFTLAIANVSSLVGGLLYANLAFAGPFVFLSFWTYLLFRVFLDKRLTLFECKFLAVFSFTYAALYFGSLILVIIATISSNPDPIITIDYLISIFGLSSHILVAMALLQQSKNVYRPLLANQIIQQQPVPYNNNISYAQQQTYMPVATSSVVVQNNNSPLQQMPPPQQLGTTPDFDYQESSLTVGGNIQAEETQPLLNMNK